MTVGDTLHSGVCGHVRLRRAKDAPNCKYAKVVDFYDRMSLYCMQAFRSTLATET
jgi:hypothetical protein